MSDQLKKIYQAQLIKAGVTYARAAQAAKNTTLDQLRLIAEIWPDWKTILFHYEQEN